MTRIQVFYCGGCREAYDRGEWLSQLKDLLRERLHDEVDLCYSPCPDGKMRLIMFGCTAACMRPDASEITVGVPEHSIGPGGYFDGAMRGFEEIADIIAKEIQGVKK